MGMPAPEGGRDWNPRIWCPVVMRSFRSLAATGGNYWHLGGLVPAKVILAPHHDDKEEKMWQLLPIDSFLLEDMCNSSPAPCI